MKAFLFVVMPIAEIVTAWVVARWIGIGWMILALIVLSLLGVWQIKVQGIAAWRSARHDVEQGSSPAPAALDGVLRFLGALLLALPGFPTAVTGLVLLISPIRNRASRGAGAWAVRRLRMPFVVVTGDATTGWVFRSDRHPGVVDVEGWESDAGRSERPTLPPSDESRS